MPRAKKTPEAKPAPKKGASKKVEPALALTQEELLRIRLFDANVRLARQESTMALANKAAILAKIDPEGLVAAEEARVGRARSMEASSLADYHAALHSAAARLDLKTLEGYGIDPVSGILTKE